MPKKPENIQAGLSIIKNDLQDLKNDVMEDGAKLMTDIKEQGRMATEDMKRRTRDQIRELRSQLDDIEEAAGERLQDGLDRLEKRVRSRPAESVAVAFFAGVVASLFLGRRH